MVETQCGHCGATIHKKVSAYNRAVKDGRPLYCDKTCAGLARRKGKTPEQKKEEKRLYDMEYRAKNKAMLQAKKSAYFRRTYDPEKARVERKARMARHVAYCRRPEYKAWKRQYDAQHRAKKIYGEFWESFLALQEVEKEVSSRASRYAVYLANGTLNKALRRKREYERLNCNKP